MFDENIFIPEDSLSIFTSYDCHIIDSSGSIISFDNDVVCSNDVCDVPTFQVFTNLHYLVQYKDLKISSSEYSTLVSTCAKDNYTNFTTNVFYRHDIDSILITFIILVLIMFLFPYRIICRMFGRWFKW